MKILLAKPGLDGHDVGVKVLAHALKEAGFVVAYTGLRKSIEDIVLRAKKENADVIGLSILSGTHEVLCQRMHEVMKENKLNTPWVVGGNIPAQDVSALEKIGAKKAFATGTTIDAVVNYIKSLEKVSVK
jgi:methylmalonyl-CoA mutase C-terminal domain/subunit